MHTSQIDRKKSPFALTTNDSKLCIFTAPVKTALPFFQIYKVDTDSRDVFVWKDPGHFVSEPVFVAKPAAEREDEGVVLFTLLSAAKHNSVQVDLI